MLIDLNAYLSNVRAIAIERVPNKGLVRIKIKGKDGGWGDEVALTVWGCDNQLPAITDITIEDEPRVVEVVGLNEEECDI